MNILSQPHRPPLHISPLCDGPHRIEQIIAYRRATGMSERGVKFLERALRASHLCRCETCNDYAATIQVKGGSDG